ncbi:MAG: glycosyltransferase [Candidatus Gastranaerophilales bacterium]|nr:glycosyltransferase [Candidatus Gastranaerophilales bacterium]
MLVSVVIPTYNSEKYLTNTINSVLNQTYQNFEIIIIDDGSIDKTKELVEKINNPKIRYFYQNNAGASAARNNGINHANGELIAFLDADDEWMPVKLAKQVDILKRNDSIGMTFCSLEMIYEAIDFGYIRKYRNYKDHKDLFKRLLTQMLDNIISPSTVLLKKSLLDQVGYFNPKIKTAEDRDLWLRLGLITEFFLLNEVLVKCIKPANSLTSTINLKTSHKSYLITLKNFFNSPDLPEYLYKLKNKAYSSLYIELGIIALSRDKTNFNSELVWQYVFKSFKKDPLGFVLEYRKVKFLVRSLVNTFLYPILKKVF